MSFETVKHFFEKEGLGDRVKDLAQSSATVEEAAQALGCEPKLIAKTMSFLVADKPILVLAAGDARVDNRKFKEAFHQKAKFIPAEQVEDYIGHAPGGVCPFVIRDGVDVYLDVSLQRFELVYPAAGSGHSAVELSIPELEKYSAYLGWVDICKGWQEEVL